MINLLTSPFDASAVAAALGSNPQKSALPPLGSERWAKAADRPWAGAWIEQIARQAEQEMGSSPELTDELYGSFFITGERLPFEKVYFERRRRLGRAATAVLLGDRETRERLLPSLIAKIEETMGEESWTFPAHVWLEPSGKDPMMIDLFAAETANVLAEILAVFSTEIPEALAERIRQRLRVQYFENYLTRRTSFMWPTLPMNWNAVCHQGVLGAALAIEDDTALLVELLRHASQSLAIFLQGFGEDGSTSEGPGYWAYGFGRFAVLNAQIEARSQGQLSLFHEHPKIRQIAQFAPALAFSNGHLVNFSDGAGKGRLPSSLLAYLGDRLGLADLKSAAAEGYLHLQKTGLPLHDQRDDFFHYSRLFLNGTKVNPADAGHHQPRDIFFPDYGAVAARGTDRAGHFWEFAAKAGHNDEHHNHNDAGSFILNVDGIQVFLEIGAPEYVKAFFGAERYTFLAASSLGHSVPVVNGELQGAGRAFAAKVLQCEIGPDEVEFLVDLTHCYPASAGCRQLRRRFFWTKEAGRLEIADSFEFENAGLAETALIMEAPAVISGREILLEPGPDLRCKIECWSDLEISQEEHAYRGHRGTDEKICRLVLRHPGPVASATLGVTISLG